MLAVPLVVARLAALLGLGRFLAAAAFVGQDIAHISLFLLLLRGS